MPANPLKAPEKIVVGCCGGTGNHAAAHGLRPGISNQCFRFNEVRAHPVAAPAGEAVPDFGQRDQLFDQPQACKAHDPLRAEPVGGDFDRALRVAGAAGPAPAVMASTALLSPFPERTVREHALRAVLAQAAVPEKGELFLADPLTGENPR